MSRFFGHLRLHRRALDAALVLAVALGAWRAFQMPAAILPEVTFPRVKVIADSGERPGEEVLRAVTRPLEESLRRVPALHEMRSTSSRGSAEINLDFTWDTDMDLALQRVQARVDAVRGTLPEGTTVEAQLMSPALFPVLGFSLASSTRSLAELRDLATLRLQPELARLPGVSQVIVQGGDRLEARVTLDPAELEARGLDATGVADAIRHAGEVESVGLLDANRELYLGLADARPPNLDALAALPIPVENGTPVPLGRLGTIALAPAPQFTRYAAQSRDAVLVNLLREPSASTVDLADEARRWFHEHAAEIPTDVHVQTFYDQSQLVRASVGSVRDSLIVGALMAVLIVMLFLRSARLGLAGAVVLPGSIGLTLLGLALCGQSLNLMTLGGIAAAIGLVLDDAIVVVEHLEHHVHRHGDPAEIGATMAGILPTLAGSSLCTIAIFIPFMFLSGVTGAFFKVLALSMALMLVSSFVLCITLVPRLSERRGERTAPPSPGWRPVERVAAFSCRYAWAAFLVAFAIVGLILPLKAGVGSGFLPEMDEGEITMDYVSPPGTSVSETDAMLRRVEATLDSVPEITAWSRRTGDQLGFFITEPNIGDYVLTLRPKRTRSADEIADALRDQLAVTMPAIQFEFGQLIEDVIGDLTTSPEPIEARIFGEDRRVIEQRARDAAALIDSVRGVVDVKSGVVVSGPAVTIAPGPVGQRAGLAVDDLARATQPYLQGIEAGQIQRGARAWPVRVVLPGPPPAAGPEALGQVRIPIAKSRWVRLNDVATLHVEPGATEIDRDNQRTMVAVTARLTGRDLGSAMAEIQRVLRRGLPLGPGMSVEYAGLWAEQQDSFRGLALVLVGAAAAVALVLLASFRSWRHTGAVLLVALASLAGVFVALRVGGATFNVASFVGAIMVVGIVAENAYFLVAEHRRLLAAGASPTDAAIAAARRRARPILMTTAAGVAALAPLALGWGTGSALLKPLAIAVVGGFLVSALLLLVLLPALLSRSGAEVG